MTLLKRLSDLHTTINQCERIAERQQDDVALLAVSKTWPAEVLNDAISAGQRRFGENYLQEALLKIKALAGYDLEWHFIGPIQSNKTKDVAQYFHWVQSIDRIKIARRLSEQCPAERPNINICIQVNIDDEPSKSGVSASDVFSFAEQLIPFDRLTLRGLMIIPTKSHCEVQQRATFQRAHTLYQQLAEQYSTVDTLSMGMSNDMSLAIAEGSTMVRVGTALFGVRTTPN